MEDKIVDLNAIKPSKKTILLAGKEIDISIIPFERVLDVVDRVDSVNEDQPGYTKMILGTFSTTMKNILKDADASITDEWLLKNIDSTRMLKLINEIIIPLMQDLNVDVKAPQSERADKKKE